MSYCYTKMFLNGKISQKSDLFILNKGIQGKIQVTIFSSSSPSYKYVKRVLRVAIFREGDDIFAQRFV